MPLFYETSKLSLCIIKQVKSIENNNVILDSKIYHTIITKDGRDIFTNEVYRDLFPHAPKYLIISSINPQNININDYIIIEKNFLSPEYKRLPKYLFYFQLVNLIKQYHDNIFTISNHNSLTLTKNKKRTY